LARLELPVITVVYNNHAYGGPQQPRDRKNGRRKDGAEAQFVHDYLGSPDMNMAQIAKGFWRRRRSRRIARAIQAALGRARKATVEGQALSHRRAGGARGRRLAEKPWIPPISIARSAPGKSRPERCDAKTGRYRNAVPGPPDTSPTR